MATQSFEQLIAGANKIKTNELPESNTASLVGEQLIQMVNKQSEEHSERTAAISKEQSDRAAAIKAEQDARIKGTTEYNVSVQHPTGGISGTNKYTLETAIQKIPAELRTVGIKCSFIGEDGRTHSYTWGGGVYASKSRWVPSGFYGMFSSVPFITYSGFQDRAYENIYTPFDMLPKGTYIKNVGEANILFAKNSELEGRHDLQPGESLILQNDCYKFQTLNKAGVVKLLINKYGNTLATDTSISENRLAEGSISTSKIKDRAISSSKIQTRSIGISMLDFSESKNIFDINDVEYVSGKYIAGNSGNLAVNEVYDTSGFMSVKPGESYVYSCSGDSSIRFALFYDKDKKGIGELISYSRVLKTPSDAVYLRVSIYANEKATSQIELGTKPTEYNPFVPKIPARFLDLDTIKMPEIPSLKPKYVYLPKDIYVAVGRTIEIYYRQVILNSDKWNIHAACDCGQPLERKFRIVGDKSIFGNHTLTIKIYNDDFQLVDTHTSTIHIIEDSIKSSKKILPIGDSLTNQKPWLAELKKLNQNLVTVGTRGPLSSAHEGRSGGGCSLYNDTTGKRTYFYDANYIGAGKDANEFSEAASYNKGDFVKKKYEGSKYAYYEFKVSHAPGVWNENEVYDLSRTNPFLDQETSQFSMNYYKSKHSISYDAIIIWLGTNGINLTPETNIEGALGIKKLVDNIRREDASTPIVIVNTLFRPGQNGIGRQGNTDGYKNSSNEFKFQADIKVMLLEQALYKMLNEYPNLYLCPVATTLDSEYAYLNLSSAKQPVNPRIEDTTIVFEAVPTDSVHPQTAGYLQAADEIYSTLCAALK